MTQTSGRSRLERLADRLELGLGEDLDSLRPAQPLGAQLDLRVGLLAGDEQRAPVSRDRRERAQQQRRLPHSRLAAEQHERARHETAAEHAVELRHSGRDARCLGHLDVDEPEQRLRRRLGLRDLPDDLLDERPERRAAGTLPEPAPGGVAALGAAELDGRRSSPRVHPTAEPGREPSRDPGNIVQKQKRPRRVGPLPLLRGRSREPPPHRGSSEVVLYAEIILGRPRFTRPLSGGSSPHFTPR